MAKDKVIEKLTRLLGNMSEFNEYQIVYLMVEIRKIIEHESEKKDVKLLKFYCDWVLHIQKDQNMQVISEIVKNIDSQIPKNRLGTDEEYEIVLSFLKMKELRLELIKFLKERSVPNDLSDTKTWTEFTKALIGVLSEQPLVRPHKNIKIIEIIKVDEGALINVEFVEPSRGSHLIGTSSLE